MTLLLVFSARAADPNASDVFGRLRAHGAESTLYDTCLVVRADRGATHTDLVLLFAAPGKDSAVQDLLVIEGARWDRIHLANAQADFSGSSGPRQVLADRLWTRPAAVTSLGLSLGDFSPLAFRWLEWSRTTAGPIGAVEPLEATVDGARLRLVVDTTTGRAQRVDLLNPSGSVSRSIAFAGWRGLDAVGDAVAGGTQVAGTVTVTEGATRTTLVVQRAIRSRAAGDLVRATSTAAPDPTAVANACGTGGAR